MSCLCRFSVDEGRTWSIHNFTSTSVFVDGLLSEPGDETLVMTWVTTLIPYLCSLLSAPYLPVPVFHLSLIAYCLRALPVCSSFLSTSEFIELPFILQPSTLRSTSGAAGYTLPCPLLTVLFSYPFLKVTDTFRFLLIQTVPNSPV